MAERTIEELRRAGFPEDEIGIIGHVGPEETVPTPREMHHPEENALTGFLRGGIMGGAIGALVIVAIPGMSEVTGLGRWFEILGGAVLGAVAGGVLIAFASFLFARATTRYFAEELEKGRFIVTVKNPQRKEEALSVLRRQESRTA
jgi:hypothetical protein